MVALTRRTFGSRLPARPHHHRRPETQDAIPRAAQLPETVDRHLDRFDRRRATAAITQVAVAGNQAVEVSQPWLLAKEAAAGNAEARSGLATICSDLITVCRTIATELSPFVPAGAARLAASLATGATSSAAIPSFPRLSGPTRT